MVFSSPQQGGVQLLAMRDLRNLVPLSTAAVYKLVQAEKFPRPVNVTGRRGGNRWRLQDVNAWLQARGLPQIMPLGLVGGDHE